MEPLGWVKNETPIEQYIGKWRIGPEMPGLVPLTVIQDLRMAPMKELRILEGAPEEWVFERTEHKPWGIRYRGEG